MTVLGGLHSNAYYLENMISISLQKNTNNKLAENLIIKVISMNWLIICPLPQNKRLKYTDRSQKFITLSQKKGKTLTSCHDNKVIPPLLEHGLNHFPLYPADECHVLN